ncbi:hypothetical protein HT031_000916 [Scenedesmus sp. PABB004]|nr:hypothetical protein HT031_000916 [Scenedesmus sp. PABB004]
MPEVWRRCTCASPADAPARRRLRCPGAVTDAAGAGPLLPLPRAPTAPARRAAAAAAAQVVLKVEMACSGCSGAVERVLKKMEGVESFDVSLEQQRVVVRGAALTPEAVLATVAKTGKKAELVA